LAQLLSLAGGVETETVTTVQGIAFQPGAPANIDDPMDVVPGTLKVDIRVLDNDSGFSNNTARLVTNPTHGTAVVLPSGIVN
jgi:hypothetical protein